MAAVVSDVPGLAVLLLLTAAVLPRISLCYDNVCHCPGDAAWDDDLQDKLVELRTELECELERQYSKEEKRPIVLQ